MARGTTPVELDLFGLHDLMSDTLDRHTARWDHDTSYAEPVECSCGWVRGHATSDWATWRDHAAEAVSVALLGKELAGFYM